MPNNRVESPYTCYRLYGCDICKGGTGTLSQTTCFGQTRFSIFGAHSSRALRSPFDMCFITKGSRKGRGTLYISENDITLTFVMWVQPVSLWELFKVWTSCLIIFIKTLQHCRKGLTFWIDVFLGISIFVCLAKSCKKSSKNSEHFVESNFWWYTKIASYCRLNLRIVEC